jgi:C1A family cysteine protease
LFGLIEMPRTHFFFMSLLLGACALQTPTPQGVTSSEIPNVFPVESPLLFPGFDGPHHPTGAIAENLPRMAAGYEAQGVLPAYVNLINECPPIYDQGAVGACTAYATAKGLGEFVARKKGYTEPVSAIFLYNLCRLQDNDLEVDNGSSPLTAIEILSSVGLMPQASFSGNIFTAPTAEDIQEANRHRLFKGWRAISNVFELKQSLANGLPVTVTIYTNGGRLDGENIAFVPAQNPSLDHCVLCVGYDDVQRRFIMRNSWGTDWGGAGYFTLPYDWARVGAFSIGFTVEP